MYNDEIQESVISDLENKEITIANVVVNLVSQGYLVNNRKKFKLDVTSILIDAFENINIYTSEQQSSIERIYNSIFGYE